jgi:hypothetical protein
MRNLEGEKNRLNNIWRKKGRGKGKMLDGGEESLRT